MLQENAYIVSYVRNQKAIWQKDCFPFSSNNLFKFCVSFTSSHYFLNWTLIHSYLLFSLHKKHLSNSILPFSVYLLILVWFMLRFPEFTYSGKTRYNNGTTYVFFGIHFEIKDSFSGKTTKLPFNPPPHPTTIHPSNTRIQIK